MQVSEVMNKVMVIENNLKVKEAARIMSDKKIGSLVILEKDKIAGIITERDILRNVNELSKSVSKIMSKNVITVDEHESLDNAAILMAENKIKRLPVTHKGKLVGIVTATDLLANSDSLNENFLLG